MPDHRRALSSSSGVTETAWQTWEDTKIAINAAFIQHGANAWLVMVEASTRQDFQFIWNYSYLASR